MNQYTGVLCSWIKEKFNQAEAFVHRHSTINRKHTRYRRQRNTAQTQGKTKVNLVRLCLLSTIIVLETKANSAPRRVSFDTDSTPVKIDNCATSCISDDISDFTGTLIPVKRKVKGLAGATVDQGVMMGTILWSIEDDNGLPHELLIPHSYYVPGSKVRLLSPQHWAREAKDNRPQPRGTWCATYADSIVLEWNQRKHRRTIKLDQQGSNVATVHTAPGYNKFTAFCTEIESDNDDEHNPIIVDTNVITDDEREEDESVEDFAEQRNDPIQLSFKLDGPTTSNNPEPVTIEVDEEELQKENVAGEMLRLHHRMGHVSMRKIQLMAKMRLLPTKFAKCNVPLCTACLYGKQTR